MYRVHCLLPRASAERLSDLLADMDPSPASAVSVEEASRTLWSLDVFCGDESLSAEAAAILAREAPGAVISTQKLEDKDWVAVSLAGLPAVNAGPFVVAGWHELRRLEGGRIPIWIEAGPAFGTGHHGTTKGCLEALAKEITRRRPRRVLDIGAGSAILGLAALKRGVPFVLGTDIDAESVRIANENRRNNRVGRRLKLLHARGAGHSAIRAGGSYDLVLANILARPLVALAPEIARLLAPGGRVILSGLLAYQEPQVKTAYSSRGFILKRRRRLNGWSTLVYQRPD